MTVTMILGKKGVKYGLQLNSRGTAKSKGQPTDVALPSIFTEKDEDSDVEAEIQRQATKKRSQLEVQQQHAAALQQDPNVFDYDAVYDDMREAREKPRMQDAAARESKYIGRLMAKAKEREREQDIIYERKLAKEREKEDHLYGDKEKFVTRAYREKMAEQARFLEEEKMRDAAEAAQDVTKREDLSDFYRNLYKGTAARDAAPVKSVGGAAPRHPAAIPLEGEGAPPAAGSEASRSRDLPLPHAESGDIGGRSDEGPPGSAAGAVREADGEQAEPEHGGGVQLEGGPSLEEGSTKARPGRREGGLEQRPPADPGPSSVPTLDKEQAAAAAVAAAKERYQARKRQRVQS